MTGITNHVRRETNRKEPNNSVYVSRRCKKLVKKHTHQRNRNEGIRQHILTGSNFLESEFCYQDKIECNHTLVGHVNLDHVIFWKIKANGPT